MATQLLTSRRVLTAKPGSKEYLLADGNGLFLRVLPSGTKSWLLKFSHKGSSVKRTLGSLPVVDLKLAREQALALRRQYHEKGAIRDDTPETLDDMFNKWFTDYIQVKRNAVGQMNVKSCYNTHIKVPLGPIRLENLRRSDLLDLLSKVRVITPAQANKVLKFTRQMAKYGVKMEWLDKNFTDGIELDDAGGAEEPRERCLSAGEVSELSSQLTTIGSSARPSLSPRDIFVIYIALATMCRVGEILKAKVEHVDLDNRLWTIPAEHSKNGKPHTVYLNDIGLDLFSSLVSYWGSGNLFRKKGKWQNIGASIVPASISNAIFVLQKAGVGKERNLILSGGNWSIHDLRRTSATLLGEMGYDPDLIELCLNHTPPKLRRTYQKQVRWEHRVEAYRALGTKLNDLLGWEAVLPSLVSRLNAKRPASPSHGQD